MTKLPFPNTSQATRWTVAAPSYVFKNFLSYYGSVAL